MITPEQMQGLANTHAAEQYISGPNWCPPLNNQQWILWDEGTMYDDTEPYWWRS